MIARAPGKIILAGEHAVVHGHPALVMAVNRHARCQAWAEPPGAIELAIPALNVRRTVPRAALEGLRRDLDARYEDFETGRLPIRAVLREPADLVLYALALALDGADNPAAGWALDVSTDIPLGAGMGSSAALGVCVLAAARPDCAGSRDRMFHQSRQVERLQHGHPSGVDSFMAVHGGLAWYQAGRAEPVPGPGFPMLLAHTGTPESSTGECVEQVAPLFKAGTLGADFAAVARGLRAALADPEMAVRQSWIRRNHALLCALGVVPDRVQRFIRRLEEAGAAAKICGAGAVRGAAAGVVLILAADEAAALALAQEFGYTGMHVAMEPRGAWLDNA